MYIEKLKTESFKYSRTIILNMKYREKRHAPRTICLVGAPGHVDLVYLPKGYEKECECETNTNILKRYKLE